jgi:hypothetical protein
MGATAWLAIVGALLAGGAMGAFLHARAQRTRPHLAIHMNAPVITPVSSRAEWCIAFAAEFANVSHQRISIDAIRAGVSAPGQAVLDSKRILADDQSRHRKGPHPPDIALRLPIHLDPGERATYLFHVFFSAHVRRMWEKGLLHLYATTADGTVTEAFRILTPAAESGQPYPKDSPQ